MGYFIRKRTNGWSLLKTYYEEGICRSYIIPSEDYIPHSFNVTMTIEEAKERAKQLNLEGRKDKTLKRREKTLIRLKKEQESELNNIPQELCKAFLRELDSMPDPKRFHSLWRAARKLIKEIDIPAHEWKRRAQTIYTYFERKHLSQAYAKKIIRVMNMWGEFYSAKTNTPYSPFKSPTGFAAGRIWRAYKEFIPKMKASDGLTPEILSQVCQSISSEHYNWLFISLWFGLRPGELENIRNGEEFAYFSQDIQKEVEILNVRQTKLSNLAEEDQWKSIPIIYPEQRIAASIIYEGNYNRPHPDTIKNHTKGHHHLYAGRKGFGPLMWEKGHDVVEVSSWLGHKSIDRTYRDYMKWTKVKLRRKIEQPLKVLSTMSRR